MSLRLYIWEGNGISDAWHDDGTLVVLAESPEQAREVVRARIAVEDDRMDREWRDKWQKPYPYRDEGYSHIFDGSQEALSREPDRVEELDGPKWIAFNGGGYD